MRAAALALLLTAGTAAAQPTQQWFPIPYYHCPYDTAERLGCDPKRDGQPLDASGYWKPTVVEHPSRPMAECMRVDEDRELIWLDGREPRVTRICEKWMPWKRSGQ